MTVGNRQPRKILGIAMLVVALLGFSGPALAVDPTNILNYQGRLLNDNAVPVADASLDFQFRFFDASGGGTCLWSNDSSTCASNADLAVTLTDGLFSVNLGDTGAGFAAIPDSVFADNADVFLEVEVEGETMSPRKRVGAAAYALNAQTLDGLDSGDFAAAADAFVQDGNSFGATATLGTNDTQDLVFETDGNARMTVSSAGDFQLGVSSGALVNIGADAGGSPTPDLLVVDSKSNAGDPTGANGAIYYNASSGLFRIFENGAWKTICNKTDAACGAGSGSALSAITGAVSGNTIGNSNFAQEWDWTMTADGTSAFTFGESSASTGGAGDQAILNVVTMSGSTASPLRVTNGGTANTVFNLTSTGDLVIQDGGTTFATFDDSGNVTFTNDLGVGAAASAETLANAGFTPNGDDAFVAGTLGVESTIFTDSGLTVGASTTYADGSITTTGATDLSLVIAGGDLTFGQATVIGDGGDALTLNSSGTLTVDDATIAFTGAGSVTTPTVLSLTLDSGTTGTINLGTGNSAKTVNIGTGTAANTINIGTGGTTADAINIGTGAVANAITIGSTSATGVSITDDNWNVSEAGAANFASVGGTTPGTGAFTTLSSTGTTTLGNGTGTVAVNSSGWDITSAGIASGFTGFTTAGNVTLSGAQILGGTPLVFEGATDNDILTSFAITDPTVSNKTITFPNASGTVAVSASSPISLSATGDISCPTCATGSSVTLQQAYTNSTGGATPEIVLDATRSDVTMRNAAGDTEANFFVFQNAAGTQVARISTGGAFVAGSGTTTYADGSATATGTMSVSSGTTNALTLDSGTTGAVNLATGANAKTITIGNTTGATGLEIFVGTGALTLGNSGTDHSTTLGSTVGGSTLLINSGTSGGTYASSASTAPALTLTANSVSSGVGISLSATGLTTGSATRFTSTSNSASATAWSANEFNPTNGQGTTANTSAGVDVNYRQNTSVAGNTESAMRVDLISNTSASTDATVANLLELVNSDTATGNQITATNGLLIGNGGTTNITNGINLSGTFGTNLITSTNFTVTQAGAITASDLSCTDCLDFDSFEDTLNLDAATTVTLGTLAFNVNLDSTGDFLIQDAGVTHTEFLDDGTVVFNEDSTSTGDFRVEGDTNASLLFTDASADRVGIGTSSPSAQFDVFTSTLSSGTLSDVQSTSNTFDGTFLQLLHNPTAYTDTAYASTMFSLSNSPSYSTAVTTPAITGTTVSFLRTPSTSGSFASTLTVSGALMNVQDGSVIGTGTLVSSADVLRVQQSNSVNTGTVLNVTQTGTGDVARFNDDGTLTDATPFIIDDAGNVGIGDATPDFEFDMNGTSGFTDTVASNTVSTLQVFAASNSAAVGGAGLGAGTTYQLEDSSSTFEVAGSIDVVWDDATNALEDGAIVFSVRNNGNPSAEAMRISSNSSDVNFTPFVGIGDTTPDQTLDIATDDADYAVTIFNDGNLDTRFGIFIEACLDTNPTSACDYIQFADGNGTSGGVIEGNGAGGVAYTTTGTDFAELFPGTYTSFSEGDIVTVDEASGQVRLADQDDAFIGVVSHRAGYLGNHVEGWEESGAFVPVGLLGQVPVPVSDENGPVAVGDVVGVSSVPGTGAKMTGPGFAVGVALQDFTGPGSGTINVLIRPHWNASSVLSSDGSMPTVTQDLAMGSTGTADAITQGFASHSLLFRGSGWNGAAAEDVSMSLVTDVTDSNDYRLSVKNTSGTTAAFVNDEGDLAIAGRFYPSAMGTLQTDKYVYYGGVSDDYIRTNASGFGTGSYDFAEMFPSSQPLEPGDVVVFDQENEHVRKSAAANETKLAGIVSTKPGFLAGTKEPGTYPIALAGRVPTNVSTENGAIEIGDPLTSSSTQGVAMKATAPGMIVGYALEPASANGSIVAFVSPGYWSGGTTQPTAGTDNSVSGFGASSVTQGGNATFRTLTMEGSIVMQGNSIVSVGAIEGLANAWSIDANGTIKTAATLKTVIESYQGEKVETAAVTSTDTVITLVGTGSLENGSAAVRFEEVSPSFNDVISTTGAVRVVVTPNGPVSLYVAQKDHDGFTVTQIGGIDSGITFDWMVTAYRKDFEPVAPEPAVEEVPMVEEPAPVVEETPMAEEPVPAAEEPAPTEEPPPADEAAPAPVEALPTDDVTPPAEEAPPPTEEQAPPPAEEIPPAEAPAP